MLSYYDFGQAEQDPVLALQKRVTERREQVLPEFKQVEAPKFVVTQAPTSPATTVLLIAAGALAALMLLR